ncbi:MAG: DUF4262 domain-containing protein [Streptomycetaceae bacterium]|nr:DUF4262 domain-containing protein [Streptomycetaceae bacterium]
MDAYLDRLRGIIRRNGYAVQYVFADPESGAPPFTYTVGLHRARGYEPALSGLASKVSMGVLNSLVARLDAGSVAPEPGGVGGGGGSGRGVCAAPGAGGQHALVGQNRDRCRSKARRTVPEIRICAGRRRLSSAVTPVLTNQRTGPFTIVRAVHGSSDWTAPVWQAVWPDAEGRFPGEVGYRFPAGAQTFL